MTLLTLFICDENNILLKQESQVIKVWDGAGAGGWTVGTLHSHLLYGTPELIKTSDIRLYYLGA